MKFQLKTNLPLVVLISLIVSMLSTVLPMNTIALEGQCSTFRVSISSTEISGNSSSTESALSDDGRYVVFKSIASNLVSNDTNNTQDVFVRDRTLGETLRVSVSSSGVQGNQESGGSQSLPVDISGDGRYVVFQSNASNLVNDDTEGKTDIFRHDLVTGATMRISVSYNGTEANGHSTDSTISSDGRYVAFFSQATNLINGGNSYWGIYVRDIQTNETTLVSVSSSGVHANAASYSPVISADGRYVTFSSGASNLVANDTNSRSDIFVHDRQTGSTTRVSISSNGTQGNESSTIATISEDGRYVAFESRATNLVSGDTSTLTDIFIHDQNTGMTWRASVGFDGSEADSASEYPRISDDGRYVVYHSDANNIIENDTNIFAEVYLYDVQTHQNTIASISTNCEQGNLYALFPNISRNGDFISYYSLSTGLVPEDTNNIVDTFVFEPSNVPPNLPYSSYAPLILANP